MPRRQRPPRQTLSADHSTQRAFDAIRQLVRVLRESSRKAEQMVGLSGAQLYVLQKLAEGGTSSLAQLAARTFTHQSSVSVVVDRLVERGLVSRVVSPLDGRRREMALTAAGRLLVHNAPDVAQERMIAGLRRLPEPIRKSLAENLESLVAALGIGTDIPPMFFEERS